MNIHFVGCEGISMRTLMQLAKEFGHTVTGSDRTTTGHKAEFAKNADLVVYSAAISADNPELVWARQNCIKTATRAEFLAYVSKNYKSVVAISGCHGKTSTTAMLYSILKPDNPTVHIGAETEFPLVGKKNIFITEACEYKRSFLELNPTFGVITNIDFDHPDCYDSLNDTKKAFSKFCLSCKTAIINADDKNSRTLLKKPNTVSFGYKNNADFMAKNYVKSSTGCIFEVFYKSLYLCSISLNVKGEHNFYNALAAASCAFCMGVSARQIVEGLKAFTLPKRRNELLGRVKNCDVFSDYAHHPKEIESEISLLKNDYKRVAVVFQPHTFTRTEALFSGFVSALSKADRVYLLPTYSAREKGRDNCRLAMSLRSAVMTTKAVLPSLLSSEAAELDALCFMGAGDVDEIAREFIKDYRQ